MQQREADKIAVVLCPWQVRRHLSGSSVLACIALRLRTENTRQSGNFGPCQEVGVYFVMTSRLLAQVHQLDVSVCQSFRDSRKEREVRPCAVIMRWVTSCKQNKSSKPSHCTVSLQIVWNSSSPRDILKQCGFLEPYVIISKPAARNCLRNQIGYSQTQNRTLYTNTYVHSPSLPQLPKFLWLVWLPTLPLLPVFLWVHWLHWLQRITIF